MPINQKSLLSRLLMIEQGPTLWQQDTIICSLQTKPAPQQDWILLVDISLLENDGIVI